MARIHTACSTQEKPPCSPCPVHTLWRMASLQLKETFGLWQREVRYMFWEMAVATSVDYFCVVGQGALGFSLVFAVGARACAPFRFFSFHDSSACACPLPLPHPSPVRAQRLSPDTPCTGNAVGWVGTASPMPYPECGYAACALRQPPGSY